MVKKWNDYEIQLLKNNLNKTYDELTNLLNRSKQSIRGKIRKINYNKEKTLSFNDINWNDIQDYYDNNKTWDDVINEYNISYNILNKALKLSFIKSRTRSNASTLSQKLKPRKVSDETKKKISESRIKYLKENPDKVPYLLNHYSKGESYPEEYFDKIFKKYKLEYVKQLQISIYQLDFAFIEKGLNIEIDGEQHYLDGRILESNKRKDLYLKENGWEVLRIRWSDYQKIEKINKIKYINELIDYINNKTEILPSIITNKHICVDCGKEIDKKSVRCIKCNSKKRKDETIRRIPNKETLLNDIKEFGYCGTGRKYNVSDNTIRKWLKILDEK